MSLWVQAQKTTFYPGAILDGSDKIDPARGEQENFERREVIKMGGYNAREKGAMLPQVPKSEPGFCCCSCLFLNPIQGEKNGENKNYQ